MATRKVCSRVRGGPPARIPANVGLLVVDREARIVYLCPPVPTQSSLGVAVCPFQWISIGYFATLNAAFRSEMVKDVVIRAEGLGKKYLIGHTTERGWNITFRDTLIRGARDLWRKAASVGQGRAIVAGDTVEEFWALKDVSFEVQRGEVLGIIGRNGAGKSTILKILSRITEPSEGSVTIDGRVASLLEVGTGFHPELTGRENIYLNGAILGMRRDEIGRKFDEIVAFAEVERFLDTPVKRYSSGMYVRLAFAVAAHLEPEILIVDEVLSVGDVEFQRKCLGKMEQVSRQDGRTVLFVSHNLGAVAEMADRALLLDSGSIAVDGSVEQSISAYLSKTKEAIYIRPLETRHDVPHIERVEVLTSEANDIHRFGQPLEVKILIRHPTPMSRACASFHIVNNREIAVIHAFAYYPDFMFGNTVGSTVLRCTFPHIQLNVGQFHLRVFLTEPPGGEVFDALDGICYFEVIRTDRTVLWDWRPEACVYHEQYRWTAVDSSSEIDFNMAHSAPEDEADDSGCRRTQSK
jgi:lipopolysaccharide transport system ATP-binding protein